VRQIAGWLDDSTFQKEQLYDPAVNVRYGTEYLARMLKRYNNNKVLALAAYNAGPHRARRWYKKGKKKSYDEFIEDIEFTETRKYIKKVLRNYYNFKDIWKERN
jgi:soluble lytic murein transglycosylase-like protein